MKTQSKQLFGGALMCAGLAIGTAASVATADFIPVEPGLGGSNLTQAFLFNGYSYQGGVDSTSDAAFTDDQYESAYGSYSAAYSSSTIIGAAAQLTDLSYWTRAYAAVIQWFTPDEDGKEITFEWNLTSAGGASRAYVYELGAGNISTFAAGGTSGSETLTLAAGTSYAILAVVDNFGSPGSGWANISNVPAPGSVALLGLAVVAGRRRRRA